LLIAGFQGQPAAAAGGFDYDLSPGLLNALVAIGNVMLLVTVLGVIGLSLRGFRNGEVAGDDPWDGQTLEWATTSPPPADNFTEIPRVASAEPLLDLKPSQPVGSEA
jgi:heme/copper-type cytochrome/quinol oxidase subunit 1